MSGQQHQATEPKTGWALKAARTQAGLDIDEAARLVGWDRDHYIRVEAGGPVDDEAYAQAFATLMGAV